MARLRRFDRARRLSVGCRCRRSGERNDKAETAFCRIVPGPCRDRRVWRASRAETFEIGVVTPLSGGGADYGIAFQNGIKMAVEEINKAGGVSIGGKTYTVSPGVLRR